MELNDIVFITAIITLVNVITDFAIKISKSVYCLIKKMKKNNITININFQDQIKGSFFKPLIIFSLA